MAIKKRPSKAERFGVSLLMTKPREIGAAEFKATCLKVMDEVERLGVEVVITKHRRPVARLSPVRQAGGFCGSLEGMVVSEGDLVSPIETEWSGDASNFA